MILVDTAPLVALVDAGQGSKHTSCIKLYRSLREPMLTTWCSFTEAMYLVHRVGGWSVQKTLWQFVQRKALYLHTPAIEDQQRIFQLMEQYRDVPMDLADASLVAAAETLGMRRIFTLDNDFHIYRLFGREAFEVLA